MYDYTFCWSFAEGLHWGPGAEGRFLGGDSAGELHFEDGEVERRAIYITEPHKQRRDI